MADSAQFHWLLLFSCYVVSNSLQPHGLQHTRLVCPSLLPGVCSKVKVKVAQSCLTLCDPSGLQPARLLCPWNSPGQNTGVGSLSLLQGIFPTQGPNPGLLHCRKILYYLSHQGSARILEQVAYPLSSKSSQAGNQTRVSCIASGFFTFPDSSGKREAHFIYNSMYMSIPIFQLTFPCPPISSLDFYNCDSIYIL